MEKPGTEKWRVCCFCFKAIPPPPPLTGGEEEQDQVLQQFVTIFTRHVSVNATLWRTTATNAVTSCPECSLLMTTFCKLHHQIKSLELMAEWKIRQLKDVVTMASQMESRTEQFKDDEGALQDVTRFRKEFVSACDKQLSKTLPRVSLTRCPVMDSVELKFDTFSDSVKFEKPPEVNPFAEAAFESHFEVTLVCSCGKSFESELKLTNHSLSCSNNHPETRQSIRLKMDLVTVSKCLSRLKNNWKFLCTTCKTKFPSNSHLRNHQRSFFHLLRKVIRRKRKRRTNRSRVNENVETIATSKRTKTESVKQEVVNTEENGVTVGMLRPLRKTRKPTLVTYRESDEDCSDDEDGDSTRFSDSSSNTPDAKPNVREKRARGDKKKRVRAASRPRPYKCEVPKCQLAFELKEYLENHSQLHGQFPCSFCKVVEDYAPNLAVHEASVHSAGRKAEPRKKNVNNKKQPLKRRPRPSRDFVCPRCDFSTFSKALYLNHHAETHLGLSRKCVTCPICSARFVADKMITFGYHMKSFHDTKGMDPESISKCDQCPAYFRKGFQLFRHKRKEHDVDHFSCKDCKKKFPNYLSLRDHRRSIHKTNEADFHYICDVPNCEQRFETLNELEWHTIGLHNRKKEDESVICSECGKRCTDLRRLDYHMVVHDEKRKKLLEAKRKERKFVCEKCGKKFLDKGLLARHDLFHKGPQSWEFSCLFCEKRCFSKQKLWDHYGTHTKEKPFPCQTCGEEYAHAHSLRNHMNTKHGANVKPRKYNALQLESKKGRKLRKYSSSNSLKIGFMNPSSIIAVSLTKDCSIPTGDKTEVRCD